LTTPSWSGWPRRTCRAWTGARPPSSATCAHWPRLPRCGARPRQLLGSLHPQPQYETESTPSDQAALHTCSSWQHACYVIISREAAWATSARWLRLRRCGRQVPSSSAPWEITQPEIGRLTKYAAMPEVQVFLIKTARKVRARFCPPSWQVWLPEAPKPVTTECPDYNPWPGPVRCGCRRRHAWRYACRG